MALPTSLLNTDTQSIDTVYGADGQGRLGLAVGDKTASGITPHAGWRGVATHEDGATFVGADGVVVSAGVDPDTGLVHPLKVGADGALGLAIGPAQGDLTDRSGLLTVAATSQTLMDVNTSRKYMFIQNVSATEEMWINFTTAAVQDEPSIRIGPRDTFVMESGFVSTQKVTVIATTINHKYTAKEG